MEFLDSFCIYAMIYAARGRDKVKEFFASQDGVSNVVASIILLLIVVLLIGIFWGNLKVWINKMMQTIFNTEIDAEGLTGP